MRLSDRSTSPFVSAAAIAALLAAGAAAACLGALVALATVPSSARQLQKPKDALAARP